MNTSLSPKNQASIHPFELKKVLTVFMGASQSEALVYHLREQCGLFKRLNETCSWQQLDAAMGDLLGDICGKSVMDKVIALCETRKAVSISPLPDLRQKQIKTLEALIPEVRDLEEKHEGYQIMVGEEILLDKVSKMLSETKTEIVMMLTEKHFSKFNSANIIRRAQELSKNRVNVIIRTLDIKAPSSAYKSTTDYAVMGDNTVNGSIPKAPVSFVISDEQEVVLLLDVENSVNGNSSQMYGLITEDQSLIGPFRSVV